jgi:hypothetical protein
MLLIVTEGMPLLASGQQEESSKKLVGKGGTW